MSELKEWRALPVAELRQRAAGLRKEMELLRLKLRQGGSEHPHRVRQMRRHVAQLLTLAHAADSLRRSQERASRSTA